MPLSHVTVYTRELGTVLSVFLFFFRPIRVPTERQSDDFQCRDVLDERLHSSLWMHLAHSNFSPRQPLLYPAYTLGTVPGCCDIYCDRCPIFQSLFQSFYLYILLPRNDAFATALDRTVTTVCFYI